MAEVVKATAQQTSQDQKMKGALAYVLSWLTGIIVLLIANDDKFLKFHAWQSIIFGVVVTVVVIALNFILPASLSILASLVSLVCWLFMLYGAYQVYSGNDFKIPVVADYVPKN